MTDEKDAARQKILGELESIKDLLDDEHLKAEGLGDEEPPLLTTPIEADENEEPPVLTARSRDFDQFGIGDDSEEDADEDNIPLLQVEVDPEDWMQPEIGTTRRSTVRSDPDSPPSRDQRSGARERAETQPSLFDEVRSQPARQPDPADESAATNYPATDNPPLRKSENPFLPKHIRDRLHANRAAQQELVGSTAAPQAPAPTETATGSTAQPKSEDELVEEVLQKYLPRIEAELREKIRALIRERRES